MLDGRTNEGSVASEVCGMGGWDDDLGGVCRIGVVVERFKIALDCFFAIWFVVGNVWVFGGHTSSSEAPNLYRCRS